MDILEEMLKKIGEKYPLKEKDAGQYASAKVSAMKFSIKAYEAEGLGNVCLMTGKAMMGLMKMDTLVVNPFDRDMALFSYDRIHAMGNDTLFLEVYDTRIERPEVKALDEVTARYADIPNEPYAPNWYDDIKWNCSIKKKGKKQNTPRFDAFTGEYLDCYLKLCAEAPACDRESKRKAASAYTEGLLDNGGPSTDQFVKQYGKDYTAGLFRDVMFGTGRQ